MKNTSRTTSDRSCFFALFLCFTRFTNSRMTRLGLGMKPFRSSGRFSAWLRWPCRCPQLAQKGGHGPSRLRQRRNRMACLPGPIAPLKQGAGQHQVIVGTGDDLGPALGALWGTQPWDIPDQHLFVEAIAMLGAP